MYNLLVVDDEFWMCAGLKKIIDRLDVPFTVTDSACDGRQALAKLEGGQFDAIITDINMPVMDGLEMMKEMRERQFKQPVIIVSAYHEFEYARTAMRLGAVDYLIKPVKNEELSAVLTNLQDLVSRRKEGPPAETETAADFTGLGGGVELVQTVLGTIERSYMEDLSLAILADQAGFNSSYLSRLFKIETGKGFVQYLREVRMKHACRMLKDTSLTNIEIAKQVGYWDEKHFRRTFKKDFGMTPGEYREKYQSKK
ncbi:response regulator transcription factor [Paenibacillus puerhi]|uniref:response regulator transcription factor n=1 Tax=Paenibacillus puerhi TaxID=2692622 RepID=UPI001357E60E|nr:response regulator [Paenibacillus puerhi]